jgi:tRNA A37 threonylcarbamoyladenosine synthetase subunit TsaC/SUA5/YrdC
MGKIVDFKNFMENLEFFVQEAKNWKVFIYPTDTIYWIWAIWDEESIKKIAEIKHRNWNKMFSIIAPNFEYEWIVNWCKEFWISVDEMKDQLNKYHWVTRIFSHERPGIRIIKHDFQHFVEKLWMPFITTSVNISWDVAATEINLINKEIADNVDYIIDDWICAWKPSVLIDFVDGKVIER